MHLNAPHSSLQRPLLGDVESCYDVSQELEAILMPFIMEQHLQQGLRASRLHIKYAQLLSHKPCCRPDVEQHYQ